jgi:polysaccharide export outer membrane protein
MKRILIVLLALVGAGSLLVNAQSGSAHAGSGGAPLNESSNLPSGPIGKNDLVGISVYDSPEFTRTVRISADGELRLPMLQKPIVAAGLYPQELEKAIREALIDEQVLIDPVVTVSIVEYRSRPISVVGAVKNPVTFQDTGVVTLLDALSQAGGLMENAGKEILVSDPQLSSGGKTTPSIQHVPVRGLYDGADPSLNMVLHGGEVIRVPEAGRVYVLGNVKKPGMFLLTDDYPGSVLKALALSDGLDSFTGSTAYIYRTDAGSSEKREIPIELKKIIHRKSPDVALLANDILYVPQASGRKAAATTFDRVSALSVGLANLLLLTAQ